MGEYQRNLRARLRKGDKPGAKPMNLLGTMASAPQPKSDFLASRRMFAIVDGEVRIAGPGSPRFHREWLKELDRHAFDRIVRGYYFSPNIVFYQGHFAPVTIRAVREHLARLKELLGLPEDTQVYSGARPASGDDLVGEHHLGPMSWLIEEEEHRNAPLPAVEDADFD